MKGRKGHQALYDEWIGLRPSLETLAAAAWRCLTLESSAKLLVLTAGLDKARQAQLVHHCCDRFKTTR